MATIPASDMHLVPPTGQGQFAQLLAALAVSLGPFAAGVGKGYSSPALASLQEQAKDTSSGTFSVSDQEGSWVASLSLLGALFGGILGAMALRVGRKKTLLLVAAPFSASWLLTIFANRVEMIYATSFIGGFCSALVLLVSQVYISEIAHPDIRGCLSALSKIAGHVGLLMSFILGAYLDWRQLAMVATVAPLTLLGAVAAIPETPSFLLLQEKDEEACRSLQWLRGSKADIGMELSILRSNIRKKKEQEEMGPPLGMARMRALAPRIGRPVLITCGLMFFQRFSGANAFNFYAVPIFRQTFGGMNPHGAAVAVGGVQLLAAMTSGLLIDTVGRIPLLIGSNLFISVALAAFGLFVYYEDIMAAAAARAGDPPGTHPHLDWIPLVCVLVFTLAFSVGIGPISWLLIGELFPLEHRGLGGAMATSFSYACAFVGVKTFVDFRLTLGLYGAFWLYSAISVVGLFFVVVWVPETKGVGLEEMEQKATLA